MTTIVTFDAGQTLVELDLDFLARRVAICDVAVEPEALRAAESAAWQRYDALVEAGQLDHPALWRALMLELLTGAGARGDVPVAVDWLYTQQPVANLFRRPIDGMVELARELAARGARVGVLSNSEGGLAALLEEIGIAEAFERIIDSARVGFAKPDRRIFDLIERELRADLISPRFDERSADLISPRSADLISPRSADSISPKSADLISPRSPGPTTDVRVHIGDSWAADVRGAIDAGWHAVWFGRHARPVDDPRVAIARDAIELRAALAHLL